MQGNFIFLPSDLQKILMEGRYEKEVILLGGSVKVRMIYMQKIEEDNILEKLTEEERKNYPEGKIDYDSINKTIFSRLEDEKLKVYIKDEKGQYIYKPNDNLPAFIYDTCKSMYEGVKQRSVSYLFGEYNLEEMEEKVADDTGKPSSIKDSTSK